MYRGFPYIKLKEICDVNQGLQIPIDQRFTENGPNRYFYITVQFLKTSHVNKFYVENPPPSSICNEYDILIVRTGSTGQIVTGVNGCFHNNFFKVNFNKDIVNGRYLYHCLNTKEKYKEMLRRAGVTTIPDLNHFMFLDMEIPLPEKNIQVQIAKTLDSLDSKIELNNKINAELEAMAKTIYDYWFVQFDFPSAKGKPYKSSGGKMVWNEELKRDIPVGWEVKLLGTEIEVQRGISYTSKEINGEGIPMINLASFNLDGTYKPEGVKNYSGKFTEKNIVSSGELLIAATDVTRNADIIGKAILVPDYYNKKLVFSMDIAKIISNNIPSSYLMMLFNSNHYHNYIKWYASGTIVLHLNLDGVKRYNMELPPKHLLEKFHSLYQPIAERIYKTALENKKLAELRDWLLPMLMNGQVKVGDAVKMVEEKLSMAAEPSGVYKKSK
jgi:type I restriction enzyme S subunit